VAVLAADLPKQYPEITLGYRAFMPEVWVKISASGSSFKNAEAKLTAPLQEAEKRFAHILFGRDDETLPHLVASLLTRNGKTLGTAESCTGGLIASMITALEGASNFYKGGAVTYSNELKIDLLGVSPATLDKFGAVSAQTVEEMCLRARKRFCCDYTLAVSGIAGPMGGTPEKPVGLVYIGLAFPGGVQVVEKHFRGDRARIQKAAALTALEMLRRKLLNLPFHLEGTH
jgi:nicotinamide-nucleotide amidase